MKRSDFLHTSLASGVLLMLPTMDWRWFAEEHFTSLRGNVGIFTLRGGTIGWYFDTDAAVVIDSQFPDSARECWKGLQKKKVNKLNYLINSHHHGDHTGGNGVFKEYTEHILAHKNVPINQKNAAASRSNSPEPVLPDLTFEKEKTLSLGKENIQLSYISAAHTNGDAIIHFEKANVAHLGDLVFNGMPAFIDKSAGAMVSEWISYLEKAHKMFDDDTLFIFGHGSEKDGVTGGKSDLLVMRDFLSATVAFVEKEMKAGKTVDEIKKTIRIPGFEDHYREDWPGGIPNMIGAVYQELNA